MYRFEPISGAEIKDYCWLSKESACMLTDSIANRSRLDPWDIPTQSSGYPEWIPRDRSGSRRVSPLDFGIASKKRLFTKGSSQLSAVTFQLEAIAKQD